MRAQYPPFAAALFAPAVFSDRDETDRIVKFFGGRPGVFVEVGAFDPFELSQTCRLEQAGWRGVLVEPLPDRAEKLRRHRRAAVYEVAAGAPEDEGRDLPLIAAGGLSTLMPALKHLGAQPEGRHTVRVRTLDSVLADAGIGPIDFVSIDVEGMELQVLRGFSLQKHKPRLVLIEDDAHDLSTHRHMLAENYKLVRRTALNNWYVPRETAFPVSAFGRWQMFRKLYLGLWPRRIKYALRARRIGRRS